MNGDGTRMSAALYKNMYIYIYIWIDTDFDVDIDIDTYV